ncbi:hypothetical protein Glove_74g134 [Diversispora epigaea]|uniref:Uncharacterized protein n=1 Tax=Diversispora epigaea TaxID=1348612 RepID=A0A397JDN5_9GLOM|nr:hypothetical protein Glove_74g134 [Diversispora epigaea]
MSQTGRELCYLRSIINSGKLEFACSRSALPDDKEHWGFIKNDHWNNQNEEKLWRTLQDFITMDTMPNNQNFWCKSYGHILRIK